jgi:hypothetical protein
MNPLSAVNQPASRAANNSRWQRIGPIVTLLLLAPVIAEVLPGFTRFSVIFVVVPEIMTWGCGGLLIREYAQRWNKGWTCMLLLGIALAVAEEWVIQQTSIAPLVGLARSAYGRVWGVNWVYFLWAVGYESVWVGLIPAKLTELLFAERRNARWLQTRGFVIAHVVFVIGAFMAWYGWTQRARVKIFHLPPYSPPPLYIVGALIVIGLLILAARAMPASVPPAGDAGAGKAHAAWLVAVAGTVLGTGWAAYVLIAFAWLPTLPVLEALTGGMAWCVVTFFLVRRWSAGSGWGEAQRFALLLGAVLGCSLGGYASFATGGALRVDWIGKSVIDVAAVLSFIPIWARVRARIAAC